MNKVTLMGRLVRDPEVRYIKAIVVNIDMSEV